MNGCNSLGLAEKVTKSEENLSNKRGNIGKGELNGKKEADWVVLQCGRRHMDGSWSLYSGFQ